MKSDRKPRKCLDDYEFIKKSSKNGSNLGKGAFGKVNLVKDKSDG